MSPVSPQLPITGDSPRNRHSPVRPPTSQGTSTRPVLDGARRGSSGTGLRATAALILRSTHASSLGGLGPALVAVALLTACTGRGEPGCDALPELSPCADDDGLPGVCALSDCVVHPPCPAGGCDESGPRTPVAPTNLRVCYGPSGDGIPDGTIACPAAIGSAACADTPYCGTDAQYGWDARNPASVRFDWTADGAEPVIRDVVTGLSWMGCVHGQQGGACAGEGARVDGFEAASICRDATWGGHDDWVLPSAHELHSIVDFGRTAPAFDLSVFLNAPSSFAQDYEQWWIECAWTRTDYAQADGVAWAVITNNGDVSQGSGVPYHLHDRAADGWDGCTVRCVRESAPLDHGRFARLVPEPDEPIVVDTIGRRIWQGCAAGQRGESCAGAAEKMTWAQALSTCEGLRWGGHDDWRLPDIKELRSLVDERRARPAIDPEAFPSTPFYGPDDTSDNVGQFWSSTARSYNNFALYADFGTGFSHFFRQDEGRHVRCVRGDPPG